MFHDLANASGLFASPDALDLEPATKSNVIKGTDGADSLDGTDGADTILGRDGTDTLNGWGGDDTLSGDAGDDVLSGGGGNDLIKGGAGLDRAAFAFSEVGVHVSLALTDAQNTGFGKVTLSKIENLSGSDFNDNLAGSGGDNWLWSLNGDDTLSGGGGDDLLQIGFGDSKVVGGAGVDTLLVDNHLGFNIAGVELDLSVRTAQETNWGDITLKGIENISASYLQGGDDTLTGSKADNILAGGDGRDVINGEGGDDLLLGDGWIHDSGYLTDGSGGMAVEMEGFGAQADFMDGGSGDDTLVGGGGNDDLTGGTGADTFLFLSLPENPAGSDVIDDLQHEDLIDVSAIDANVNKAGDQSFVFVDSFSGKAGEAVLETGSSWGWLRFDVDGDGRSDMAIQLNGDIDGFNNYVL